MPIDPKSLLAEEYAVFLKRCDNKPVVEAVIGILERGNNPFPDGIPDKYRTYFGPSGEIWVEEQDKKSYSAASSGMSTRTAPISSASAAETSKEKYYDAEATKILERSLGSLGCLDPQGRISEKDALEVISMMSQVLNPETLRGGRILASNNAASSAASSGMSTRTAPISSSNPQAFTRGGADESVRPPLTGYRVEAARRGGKPMSPKDLEEYLIKKDGIKNRLDNVHLGANSPSLSH